MEERVMIGGEMIDIGTQNYTQNYTHSPDEYNPKETELTELDKQKVMQDSEALASIAAEASAFFDGPAEEVKDTKGADFSSFGDILSNFKPKEVKQDAPMVYRGYFKARIDSIRRYTGESMKTGAPYDMYSFNVVAYAPGNKKTQGYLGENGKKFSETFSLIDGQYSNAKEDFEKLLNFLFYAGIDINFDSWDSFDNVCADLEGKTCFINVKPRYQWKKKDDGTFEMLKGDDGKGLLKLDKDGYPMYKWDIVPNIPNMIKDDAEGHVSSVGVVPVF